MIEDLKYCKNMLIAILTFNSLNIILFIGFYIVKLIFISSKIQEDIIESRKKKFKYEKLYSANNSLNSNLNPLQNELNVNFDKNLNL